MSTNLPPGPSDAFVPNCESGPFPGEDRSASYAVGSSGSDPEFWLYRERTIALLRRYLRISIEVGRLPRFWAVSCFAPKSRPTGCRASRMR